MEELDTTFRLVTGIVPPVTFTKNRRYGVAAPHLLAFDPTTGAWVNASPPGS